jgi:protein-S-isoprenylcysteine O-methyltransferase Ste14
MSDKSQAGLLVVLQFVILALLVAGLLFLPASQVSGLRLAGFIIAVAGLVVIAVGVLNHLQVNRAIVRISPEPDASRQLVEIGLYRWIRHPLYLGAILVGFGAAIAHGHGMVYAVALLLCLFFTYKSTFEERWLMRVYPGYVDYRRRTGRFLPLQRSH